VYRGDDDERSGALLRAGRRVLPLVAVLGALSATAAALAGTVSWGSAIEVPGTTALNVSGYARVDSVSCASAGNCAAGGLYGDASGSEAFVVSDQGGVWGTATEVPGSADLNGGGYADVVSVSCAGAGDCAAGGTVWDGHFLGHAFVVDETNGVWGSLADLDVGGDARVNSVSCTSPGNCAAAGSHSTGFDKYDEPIDYVGFVVAETNGSWGTPMKLPAASVGRSAGFVASVSCVRVAYCVAGGSSASRRAFLVTGRDGNWGNGTQVPGMKALSVGSSSYVTSVSCASPGTCTAAGDYTRGSGRRLHAFVVVQKNGRWGNAIQVLGGSGSAYLVSLSCAESGNCSAGGFTIIGGEDHAFVVSERKGTWGHAIPVRGLAALDVGGNAGVNTVSCASAGNCAATGFYTDGSHKEQAFVVAEQSGVWRTATEVPGTAALGGGSGASSVSCAGAGRCAVGGGYVDGSGHPQAFVTAP
jgi:hypothetical protein